MAAERKRVRVTLTTTAAPIHRVPPEETHQIVSILLTNADAQDRWVKLWLLSGGEAAPGAGNALTSGAMPVPAASQPMERFRGLVFEANDTLYAQGEVNSQLCATIFYIRIFPDDAV